MNKNFYRNNWRKVLGIVLILVIIFPSIFLLSPRKAEAQWVVWDPSVSIKDYLLDNLAWMIVNMIIERIAASTVNWINSGFQGSPAFVTDPNSYFKNIGNQVAGQIIYNHPDLRFMCAPLRAKVQIALTKNYIQPFGNYQCTLSQVGANFDNFMNDFSQGGWDNFIQISQNSQNNPLGLYNQAQNQLNISIGSALGQKQQELSWGNGFLSFKSCEQYSTNTPGQTVGPTDLVVGVNPDTGEPIIETHPGQKLPDIPPTCIKTKTSTPGSVIQEQLNKTLGVGNERLQVADEINEIISALLNQLVSKAIGAVGGGLRSLSSPGSGGSSGNTFTDQLNASQGRNIMKKPSNGVCPGGTVSYSATECITDENQIATDVTKAEIGATQLINKQDNQVNRVINPGSTSCYPLFEDPVSHSCIDCNLGTSLNSTDYATCQNAGLIP